MSFSEVNIMKSPKNTVSNRTFRNAIFCVALVVDLCKWLERKIRTKHNENIVS